MILTNVHFFSSSLLIFFVVLFIIVALFIYIIKLVEFIKFSWVNLVKSCFLIGKHMAWPWHRVSHLSSFFFCNVSMYFFFIEMESISNYWQLSYYCLNHKIRWDNNYVWNKINYSINRNFFINNYCPSL